MMSKSLKKILTKLCFIIVKIGGSINSYMFLFIKITNISFPILKFFYFNYFLSMIHNFAPWTCKLSYNFCL